METTLHRQLKEQYAGPRARQEVQVDGFRIDVVRGRELIEVQHGPLSALRDKTKQLLTEHRVRIVKTLVGRKMLIKRKKKDGEVVSRRWSPKRGGWLDVFDELIHFMNVFPHPQLKLELLLVDIEEWRYPGHGRRRWRRPGDHQVEDQKLLDVTDRRVLQKAKDLQTFLPRGLPKPFDTAELCEGLGVERWAAQRMAYCMRKAGAIQEVGRRGNALLYEIPRGRKAA